ncbi:ras-related protein Rap-1b-like [Eriocheir sinensis]|uniref:ras-related protein Rap-1b-like n=1 Tax=Eriocheir sinensis TaxID=95602 RepID=UPI0021C67D30|nr:ras-related protein Rap-1b-like [Eriocheir sinensis]
MKENKLVILGGGGVGKTSLVLQFLQGIFNPVYRPTVEDCYSHTLQLPSGLFQSLEILDTSGTHCFPAMRELSIRSGKAFLLVFAVNSQQSFYEAQALWDLIKSVKDVDNVPTVLVGNKVDAAGEREVPWEEGHAFAAEHMPCGAYLETSAKFNLNVDLVFRELLVLAFGLGKDEKKERRPSRIKLSLSDLSLTLRRKSSGAMSTGSGTTLATVSCFSTDDETPSTPTPSPHHHRDLHHHLKAHGHRRCSERGDMDEEEDEEANNRRQYHHIHPSLMSGKEKCVIL